MGFLCYPGSLIMLAIGGNLSINFGLDVVVLHIFNFVMEVVKLPV